MSAAGALPQDRDGILALLADWVAAGWLRSLDRAFAAFLAREAPATEPLPLLLAAIASQHQGRGHVCLDLEALAEDPDATLGLAPPVAEVAEPLRPAACLGGHDAGALAAALGGAPVVAGSDHPTAPLVLEPPRLYLRRYRDAEARVAEGIAARLATGRARRAAVDPAALARWLEWLFGSPPTAATDWQRVACALVAGGDFGVITGGPGTGKTTTVVRLLAILQGLALEAPEGRALRIALAAPTGKAAARLNRSVAGAVAALALPGDALGAAVRDAVPTRVTTLHRLLGSQPGSRRFRHDARHPLALDVLVVDEASMVDLELMDATLAALPAQARLVLLGDRDQLASVEAGAVLGELCARARAGAYSRETADWLVAAGAGHLPPQTLAAPAQALDQQVVMLRHSHRFPAEGGIGRLAAAVNAGDAAGAEAVLDSGAEGLARLRVADGADGMAGLESLATDAVAGYGQYLARLRAADPGDTATPDACDAWAHEVLRAHAGFQLLAALRAGPWGVEALNVRIAGALEAAGAIAPRGVWYEGRPVMVTRNDYGLGLMNGDLGIALRRPEQDEAGHWRRVLRVAFPAADSERGVRWVLPSRLDAVDTVFAMTVHKAQGSEFRHACLVLPERTAPVLTRELVYTAITRAAERFTLAEAAPGGLRAAIGRSVRRCSGLEARLRGG
ncbi:exodeoxyribonuclease V subunit alpha [Sediminicurvatus halobius]|uniref:RecBCD enzyme subunit RecD n=1 Tax=Sediminicurvatus halobius TaxID=2182432 RepID=A0A2U2MZJ1_9GAMM|nr:exodeoxyribonuclease V subunit alpha [Spiribacter halobius]PWG62346.1 exodeoxyribonuclease V subunit alpha [Spiribacter halobius]UEX79731.1 exodeoxyribonuclease V subunit alpha [Spiribacter halobius]